MSKALIHDSQNLIPKLATQSIKSIKFVGGDGGVGSIIQTNVPEGSCIKYLNKIEVSSTENYVRKNTSTKLTHEVEFEASGGGCIYKMTSHYHTEEVIMARQDKALGIYEFEGEYVLANPDAFGYHTKGGVKLKEEKIKAGNDKALGIYEIEGEFVLAYPDAFAHNTKGGVKLQEEEVKADKDKTLGIYEFKGEYYLANPMVFA